MPSSLFTSSNMLVFYILYNNWIAKKLEIGYTNLHGHALHRFAYKCKSLICSPSVKRTIARVALSPYGGSATRDKKICTRRFTEGEQSFALQSQRRSNLFSTLRGCNCNRRLCKALLCKAFGDQIFGTKGTKSSFCANLWFAMLRFVSGDLRARHTNLLAKQSFALDGLRHTNLRFVSNSCKRICSGLVHHNVILIFTESPVNLSMPSTSTLLLNL